MKLPGEEEHGRHTAEFGLCIEWLSHIPKLHLHGVFLKVVCRAPAPSWSCRLGHPPLLPVLPRGLGRDLYIQEGRLGFPSIPGKESIWVH